MDLLVLGLLQKILSGSGNTVIAVIIDAILSETSENPVQNKVIKIELDNKADKTVATTETDGLMSAADKAKLDDISKGDNSKVYNFSSDLSFSNLFKLI